MKTFYLSFLVVVAACCYFWATDAPDSGMGFVTAFFAVIPVGVAIYNTVKNGGPMNDSTNR
ncbi:hypothetical protein [Hymenobacter nivis]|uniref:hypothetical protein n=1 Tax=Hymenobacter nivis TaxID=1850093 RepID=UPI0013A53CFB|nr:hypothetical protein [Hymenobacter nivis]